MAIVFDEILSEVHTPSTDRAESSTAPEEGQAASAMASRAEVQQTLERIKIRQLRLMAD
jgi:hypothetical protein